MPAHTVKSHNSGMQSYQNDTLAEQKLINSHGSIIIIHPTNCHTKSEKTKQTMQWLLLLRGHLEKKNETTTINNNNNNNQTNKP